jgi:hypothetical protein
MMLQMKAEHQFSARPGRFRPGRTPHRYEQHRLPPHLRSKSTVAAFHCKRATDLPVEKVLSEVPHWFMRFLQVRRCYLTHQGTAHLAPYGLVSVLLALPQRTRTRHPLQGTSCLSRFASLCARVVPSLALLVPWRYRQTSRPARSR